MWQIRMTLAVEPPGDCDDIRRLIQTSYLELVDRTNIYSPEMSGTLQDGFVTFSIAVDAEERTASIQIATSAVRSAMSGAGVSTPGWEKQVNEMIDQSEIASRPLVLEPA